MERLPKDLVDKIAGIRKQHTARAVSRILDVSLNTVNHATSKYKLLSQSDRMELWRKYSPTNAIRHQVSRSLQRCKILENIRFDKDFGYAMGCCFGDASVNNYKGVYSITLQTRNLSFAKSFMHSLFKTTSIIPRFYERTYDIKITPDNRVYRNLKYYVVTLYSSVFVKYITDKLCLKQSKLRHEISLNKLLEFGNDFCIGFIRGVFDSDGSIIISRYGHVKRPVISIVVYSSYKRFIGVFRKLLINFGLHPSRISVYKNNTTKEAYRLIIGRREDIIRFRYLIGSGIDYKIKKLGVAIGLTLKYSKKSLYVRYMQLCENMSCAGV